MQKPQKSSANGLQSNAQRIVGIQPFESQSKLLKSSQQSKSTSSLIHESLKNNIAQAIINSLEKHMQEFDIMGSERRSIDESPEIQYIDTPFEMRASSKVDGVLTKVLGGGLGNSLYNEKEFSFANVQLEPISGSVHQALISSNQNASSQNKKDGVGKNTRSHANLLNLGNVKQNQNSNIMSNEKKSQQQHQSLMSSRLSINKPPMRNFPSSKNQSQVNSNYGSRRTSVQTKNINLMEENPLNSEGPGSNTKSPMFREYEDSTINCSTTKEQRINKIQQQKSRQNQIKRFDQSKTPREMIKDPMAISGTLNYQSRNTYQHSVCENSSQMSMKQAYGNSSTLTLRDGEKQKNKNTCRQVYLNLQAKTSRGTNQESKMFKTPKSKDSLLNSIQLQPDSASSSSKVKVFGHKPTKSSVVQEQIQNPQQNQESAEHIISRSNDFSNMASPNSKLKDDQYFSQPEEKRIIRSPHHVTSSPLRYTPTPTQAQRLARSPVPLREEGRLFSPRLSESSAGGKSCRAIGLSKQMEREKSEKHYLKEQQSKRLTILNHKAKAKKIMEGIINQPNVQLTNKMGNVVQIDIFGSGDPMSGNLVKKQLNINTMNNQVETFDKDNSSLFHQYLQSSQSSAQKPSLDISKQASILIDEKRLEEQIQKAEMIVENLYEIIDGNQFGEKQANIEIPTPQNNDTENNSFTIEPIISVHQRKASFIKETKSTSRENIKVEYVDSQEKETARPREEILKKRSSLPNLQNFSQSQNSKYRRSRRDRVHEFNQQMSLRENDYANSEHKLIDRRHISHSQSQQELETLLQKIGVFDQTQNTNEVPSPQKMPPQPSYLNSEEKPVNFFSEQPDHLNKILPFDNLGESYYSQRQSSLLKTPRLISKSRQYRQKTYSSNSKDESSIINKQQIKSNNLVEDIQDASSEQLRIQNNQRIGNENSEEIEKQGANNSSGEIPCQDMPVQIKRTVMKQSNTEYPLKILKEKTIIKREIHLRDLDDTDTFIQLEKSIKDQIKATESSKNLQSQVNLQVLSPCNANENEQQGIINKSSILQNMAEEERQERSRKSSVHFVQQKEQSFSQICQKKVQQRQIEKISQQKDTSSSMHMIKEKMQQSIAQGRFDLKLVRQLENEAAKILQKWFRERNKRTLQPLKEGKNMSTQTYFSKEDEVRVKQKILYGWMIMNMAIATKKQKEELKTQINVYDSPASRDDSKRHSFADLKVQDFKEGSIVNTQASCSSDQSYQEEKVLEKIKVSIVQNVKDSQKNIASRDSTVKSNILSTKSGQNNKLPREEVQNSSKQKTNYKIVNKSGISSAGQQKEAKIRAKK